MRHLDVDCLAKTKAYKEKQLPVSATEEAALEATRAVIRADMEARAAASAAAQQARIDILALDPDTVTLPELVRWVQALLGQGGMNG